MGPGHRIKLPLLTHRSYYVSLRSRKIFQEGYAISRRQAPAPAGRRGWHGTARKVIQGEPDGGYGAAEDRTPAIAELWRQRHVAAAEAGRWQEINFPPDSI